MAARAPTEQESNREMRWFFLWLAAAASIALGLSIAYLGPSSLPGGKGSGSGSLMINWPLPLILVGLLGLFCSVAGILWSQSRPVGAIPADSAGLVGPMTGTRGRAADIAAGAGLALAIAALAGEIFFFVGILMAPGSYFGAPGPAGIIPVVGFGAWPLALCATVISWLAVVPGTGHRRNALLGVTLGSLTLVWLPAWFLLAAFGSFGGD